ncbi:MAG: hypothetical protein HZA46_13115 [Planctomycetales bacterium]|nr:hypothetical protein [Planctomycetales bacterium]
MVRRLFVIPTVMLVGLVSGNVRGDTAAIKEQANRLEMRAKELMEAAEGPKKQVEELGAKVDQKLRDLKALAENQDQLKEDTKRRIQLLQSDDEAKQIEALKDADQLGDDGLMLAAFTAKKSKHAKARRKALDLAVALRQDGLPVIAFSFEALPVEDRVYVVEQVAKDAVNNATLLFAAAKSDDVEVRKILIKAAGTLTGQQGLLLLSAAARDADAKLADVVAETSAKFNSDDELLILYMGAKSNEPAIQIAALKATAARTVQKETGLVAVMAAYKSTDPKVRAQLVRTAKKIGGSDAQLAIDAALRDPDEKLREAAEKALKDADDKK